MNAYEAMRAARPRAVRARSVGKREMARLVDRETLALAYQWRPRTRAHCASVPRPCPYVGCRYNLFLDVLPTGSIKLNFPDLEPEEMPARASCALDIADAGAMTERALGAALNVTRTRAIQLVAAAGRKLRRLPIVREMGQ